MSDTKLHDFCKGFGALLSRSKVRVYYYYYYYFDYYLTKRVEGLDALT
jgi:hypothetical protein